MRKHLNKLPAAAGAVMAAAAVAVSGLTAASASPAVGHRVSGTEHLQLMNTSTTSGNGHLIASGVFTGAAIDHAGNTADLVVFRNGTFKITHAPGRGHQSFNPRTCLGMLSLHGTYTLGHGTGRYAGISGHGKYQLSVLIIAARNSRGRCSPSGKLIAEQQLVRAQGPATVR
jgi:hypothetical protein